MRPRFLLLFPILIAAIYCEGKASNDSVALAEVVVKSSRRGSIIIPAQRLEGKELEKLNSHSVADALRYFSGVQIKDYGGVGGIKTVNIRSMGSNHTGVVYDGVQLGNAQNGQIDLGQFSLDNIEALSLYNGHKSNILQPARDFGNAGTIYMRTRRPRFDGNRRYNLRARMRFGAFDLINPSLLAEWKASERVAISASAEWLGSSGKYHFRLRKLTPTGSVAYDTTAMRQNGDIHALRAEVNATGNITAGSWTAKAYHYNSERGVPGAIVNNVWKRGERIWDNNSFAQGSYTKYAGNFTTLANAKLSFYRTRYVNNDEKQIKIDNLYKQSEAYLSTANLYAITPKWQVSASYDFTWNYLWSDMYNFAFPSRFSNLIAVATALNTPRIKAQASALATIVSDRTKANSGTSHKHDFSPAIYVAANPLRSPAVTLRAFFKRTMRMPTFNDLYYADMGNSALKPERVSQYDVGAAYQLNGGGILRSLDVSADIYYNYVTDKIIAYPRGQQFRWTMLNLGKVDIRGLDISGTCIVRPHHLWQITLRGQYTYQHAIDITDRRDSYYRDQIPYIPHHSASGALNIELRNYTLNFTLMHIGSRYNQQENIKANFMPAWTTSDISVGAKFDVWKYKLSLLAEINNLFNSDYQVILNYPMPRRNLRFTIALDI